MLIYGEFETIARISKCFGLLINDGFIAMEFILWILCPFLSRPPDPGLTRLADPNRSPGRDTIYTIYCILGLSLTFSFSELTPVPVFHSYTQFM